MNFTSLRLLCFYSRQHLVLITAEPTDEKHMIKKLGFSLLLLVFLLPGDLLAACASSITVNTGVTDNWEVECTSEHRAGSYAKYYTFTLTKSQSLIVDLESSANTYLFLLNGSGQTGAVIDEDDDSGTDDNSQISIRLTRGTYTIEATTFQPATTGEFIVSIDASDSLPGDCSSSISINTNVSGTWVAECESENRDDSYAKYYTFTLASSQEVTIDLESSTDTYLFLLNGSGQTGTVIAEDDDSGTGSDSQIVRNLSAGTYTVEATTYASQTTGTFTVSVNTAQAPPAGCSKLIGTNINEPGIWEADCTSTNRPGSYAKYYTFILTGSQEVTIDLTSPTDTYLFLLNRSGTVLSEDDDSGAGSNAQIVRTLSAGTYTVEATTFASATTGTFVVSVNTPPTCTDCPFQINSGLNDAWFNTATNGQGFTIIVFPEMKEMWVAWFTYDVERPPDDVNAILGDPGHRWLTAQGPYDEDTATLTIYVTEGGVFDSPVPATSTDPAGDGTLVIEFVDCTEALATYEITSLDISGVIPLERIVLDNVPLCEVLANP